MPVRTARLVALLDENPFETWTLEQMRRRVPGSKGATRIAIWRAVKQGQAVRIGNGLYRSSKSLVRLGLPDPNFRLHAIKIEARNEMVGGSFRDVFQKVTTVWASPTLHRHPRNHSVTTSAEWRGRWLTVTLHERVGLVEVFLQSSTAPLDIVLDVPAFFAAVEAVTGIPIRFWVVRQADWNIDAPVHLPGSLSLGVGAPASELGNIVVKIYQKAIDLARSEIRSFEPLTAEVMLEYVTTIWSTLKDIYRKETP